ncbi:MAG: BON domain-containing protein [Rickettsiales bacterium]|nr:BON domain-containing protein [Rickettsiales bacterium]
MKFLGVLSLLAIAPLTSGCVSALFAAGTETAVVVAQERSVGAAVDDAGIYFKIKDAFANQSNYKELLTGIDVKSVEGRVLLTGNVSKVETQIEAVRLVWQVTGVKEVIDEINVDDKSGFWNYTRDVWISAQLRSRLLFAKDIRSINYSVITVNQVVYLMGVAQDSDELRRATYIASTTSYVKQVVSYVRFKDDPRRE